MFVVVVGVWMPAVALLVRLARLASRMALALTPVCLMIRNARKDRNADWVLACLMIVILTAATVRKARNV